MNILATLASAWSGITAGRPMPAGPRVQRIGPQPTATVIPPPRFAWDEKRWERVVDGDMTQYIGRFRVYDHQRKCSRSFGGAIIDSDGEISAFCADPPAEIRSHPKGPCFMLARLPWFRIHWHVPPQTIDETILYVERLLDECLNHRKRP